eukprot:1222971-Prymnesium_polylepis.1
MSLAVHCRRGRLGCVAWPGFCVGRVRRGRVLLAPGGAARNDEALVWRNHKLKGGASVTDNGRHVSRTVSATL